MKLTIALALLASTASAGDWQDEASDAYTDAYSAAYGAGYPQSTEATQSAVRPWRAQELSQPVRRPPLKCTTYELNGFFYSSCF